MTTKNPYNLSSRQVKIKNISFIFLGVLYPPNWLQFGMALLFSLMSSHLINYTSIAVKNATKKKNVNLNYNFCKFKDEKKNQRGLFERENKTLFYMQIKSFVFRCVFVIAVAYMLFFSSFVINVQF